MATPFEQVVTKHMTEEDQKFKNFHERIQDVKDIQRDMKESIRVIKENHLTHMQADANTMKIDISTVKTNVDWLMRYHWIVATASIGALVVGVINLIQT
ncbi:MAG: hypothetical protein WAV09_04270 [Minisyncoccia bacterium]